MVLESTPSLKELFGSRLSIQEHAINVLESDADVLECYCKILKQFGIFDQVMNEALWMNYTGF